ncbi:response regulator transcription factor [Dactylosporangium sp. McL0621]|uniref:response regulator transcription factor n=1 Tax=Dactylosporangium sp. McL0621 TaxID=3415678 RepID=UPI003CF3A044
MGNNAIQTVQSMIRILLAQPCGFVRDALATVLSDEPDFDIAAESSVLDDVPAVAAETDPEVVLLDPSLPGNIELNTLCAKLLGTAPGAGVLVVADPRFSTAQTDALVRTAPRVGVIAGQASMERLSDSIRRISRGESVIDSDVAVAVLTAPPNPLTERERAVLRLSMHGAPASDVARELFLSTGTVRNYLSRIAAKTGARTRIEAIRIAQGAGWI